MMKPPSDTSVYELLQYNKLSLTGIATPAPTKIAGAKGNDTSVASATAMTASSWMMKSRPKLLNLMHDVCPPTYINMIITEVGMIPCTSVPVVLREYRHYNAA